MRARTALLLAGLAGLVLAAGIAFGCRFDTEQTSLPATQPMFPNLAASLAGARRIEIVHQGQRLVLALPAGGAAWTLPEHADFPIEPETLHTMLAGLTALRLIEPRTSQPDLFTRLGLADPAAPDADGTMVRVLAADGTPVAAVVLGHEILGGETSESAASVPGSGREDTYVRAPAERHAWLAGPALAASADWHDWVRRVVIDIRPDDVTRIVARRGDAPAITLERKDGQLVVVSPADHPALDRFKVEDMSRALASLDMLDVRPAEGAPGEVLGVATLTTTRGLSVTARVLRDGAAVWITLAAQDADLMGRLAGWSFRIAPEKESALVPAMEDLAAYAPAAAPASVSAAVQTLAAAPPPPPAARSGSRR